MCFYPKRLLHNACAVGYILEASVFHCGLQYNKVGWFETSSTLQKKWLDLGTWGFSYTNDVSSDASEGRRDFGKIYCLNYDQRTSDVKYTAKGTYLYISNIALTIAQTTQNNWVMRIKVNHEFTGDIFYLNSDIHPRSKTLILNSGFIILVFKFCPVKLYTWEGEKENN